LRTLIFFPLNLWIWAVTIPVRIFVYVVFGEFWKWSAKDLALNSEQKLLPVTERKQVPKKQATRYPTFIAAPLKSKSKPKSKSTQRKADKENLLEERFPGFITSDAVESKELPTDAVDSKELSSLFSESNVYYEFYESSPKMAKERKEKAEQRELGEEKSGMEREIKKRRSDTIKVNNSDVPASESVLKIQLSTLQKQIEEREQFEKELLDINARLEEELTIIRNSDIKRLNQIRVLLDANQKKCLGYCQEINDLKNELERQNNLYNSLYSKYQNIHDKQKQKKKNLKKKKTTPKSETIEQQTEKIETEKQAELEEPHNVWGIQDHSKDFTKMVSEAQKQEPNNNEVLKESLGEVGKVEEFVVVGGASSARHVIETPVSSNSIGSEGLGSWYSI